MRASTQFVLLRQNAAETYQWDSGLARKNKENQKRIRVLDASRDGPPLRKGAAAAEPLGKEFE
jgi:hypothetical protein